MKRILSLISVLVLILGLAIPSLSLAAPRTPAIKSANPGATTVDLSWDAVSGVKGYQIKWGRKGVADIFDKSTTTTGTSCRITGLSTNTTYAFRVRAYYKSGTKVKYTSWSAKKFVTTSSSTPSTPSISGISGSNAKVTLRWNTDSRADGYEVRWGKKGTVGWDGYADARYTGSYTATARIVTNSYMAFQIRAYWWSGSTIKHTSWSATKYVWVPGATSCSGHWSEWSTPSKTRKTVTANMQERAVDHWWAAKCKHCGTHNPYWGSNTKCVNCGYKLPQSNVSHINIYRTEKFQRKTLNGRKNGAVIDGKNYWYCEVQYQYRYWITD